MKVCCKKTKKGEAKVYCDPNWSIRKKRGTHVIGTRRSKCRIK